MQSLWIDQRALDLYEAVSPIGVASKTGAGASTVAAFAVFDGNDISNPVTQQNRASPVEVAHNEAGRAFHQAPAYRIRYRLPRSGTVRARRYAWGPSSTHSMAGACISVNP